MKREPLRPAWRRLWHVLLVLLGWIVYFGFWWKVLRGPTDLGPLFVVIPIIVIVVPAVTLFWILHNLHLYRARNARRTSLQASTRYDTDWEGRRIEADWEWVRGAAEIDIRSEGDVKRYGPPAAGESSR